MHSNLCLWLLSFMPAIHIPYGSMASAITNVWEERASLSTLRSMGASFSSLIIDTLTPQFNNIYHT